MAPRDHQADADGEADRLRFRTETGSIYEVARDAPVIRWARTSTTDASGFLGVEGGTLTAWPAVLVGYRATLSVDEGVGAPALFVHTSRVVEILEGRPAEPFAGAGGLAAGDVLVRDLAGVLVELPYLGTRDGLVRAGFGPALLWTFDADTGAEIDEELGWGPAHGRTGSRLVGVRRAALAHQAAEVEAVWARVAAGAQATGGEATG